MKKKITVLYVFHEDVQFGASKSAIDMITTLSKDYNINPIILCFQETEMNSNLKDLGIRVVATGHRRYVFTKTTKLKDSLFYLPKYLRYKLSILKAFKILENEVNMDDVDIVHTNTSVIDFGALISKKHGKPHIWHIREFGEADFNFKYMKINLKKFMNKNTSAFISISNAIQECWVKKGLSNETFSMIYNGISFDDIIPKAEYSLDNAVKKIVMIGGISKFKGQEELINAVSYLPQDIKRNIVVDIYGRGDAHYEEYLMELVDSLDLNGNINFCGFNNNVREVLTKYDIGIMASNSEAFGRVTVEYMASGLTVIASNSGANNELINDFENGCLYESKNSKDLSEKIELLYKDAPLLKKLALAGRQSALQRFSKEKQASQVFELYKNTLSN